MGNNSSGGAGAGFFTLLGVLFIGLKLANVIDWPWCAVLAPIWGPVVLVVVILAIMGALEGRTIKK